MRIAAAIATLLIGLSLLIEGVRREGLTRESIKWAETGMAAEDTWKPEHIADNKREMEQAKLIGTVQSCCGWVIVALAGVIISAQRLKGPQ